MRTPRFARTSLLVAVFSLVVVPVLASAQPAAPER